MVFILDYVFIEALAFRNFRQSKLAESVNFSFDEAFALDFALSVDNVRLFFFFLIFQSLLQLI